MIYETRAVNEGDQSFISAENHSVVLAEDHIVFISGLLPGGTRPHLFERVYERSGKVIAMAEVQLRLTAIWPTLMWMRAEQRMVGRGDPVTVMMTPLGDGLLFGDFQKVSNLPPAGPTVVVIDQSGQQTRTLRDFYGDESGNRLWAMTKTFVDGELLSPQQAQLRDSLSAFVRDHHEVVADNDWRWKIGLGLEDPAVVTVAKTFRLKSPPQDKRAAALAALEAIVSSDSWRLEAARSKASQEERKRIHAARDREC